MAIGGRRQAEKEPGMFHLKFDESENNGITVLKVSGLLNSEAYYETRDRIRALVDSGKKKIVLDLAGLERVGGTGWNALEETKEENMRREADIRICCMIEPVYKVFKEMGLKDNIRTYPTLKQALEDIKA